MSCCYSSRTDSEPCFLFTDVFDARQNSKKRTCEPIMFPESDQRHIFAGPVTKKARLSSKSQNSKSRKRSSSNDASSLSIVSAILPQKDSFKVYRSTGMSRVVVSHLHNTVPLAANSSDDSDARSASSSSAASSRSHSGSDGGGKNEPDQRVVSNGFKNTISPSSLRSASRLSSEGSLEDVTSIPLEHLDLVWAKSNTKKIPFLPAVVSCIRMPDLLLMLTCLSGD